MRSESYEHFNNNQEEWHVPSSEEKSKKNLYEILGINKNASVEDIQNAYKKLLREGLHEDKINLMPEGLEKIAARQKLEDAKEALRILTSVKARYDYDSKLRDESRIDSQEKQQWLDEYESAVQNVYDYEELEQVLENYNSNFRSYRPEQANNHRMSMEPDRYVSLAEGDYKILRMTYPKFENYESLVAFKLNGIQLGQKVKVQRSDGSIEKDWVVSELIMKDSPKGPKRNFLVVSPDGSLEKVVPSNLLYTANPELN